MYIIIKDHSKYQPIKKLRRHFGTKTNAQNETNVICGEVFLTDWFVLRLRLFQSVLVLMVALALVFALLSALVAVLGDSPICSLYQQPVATRVRRPSLLELTGRPTFIPSLHSIRPGSTFDFGSC